jgi:hypothetical protein
MRDLSGHQGTLRGRLVFTTVLRNSSGRVTRFLRHDNQSWWAREVATRSKIWECLVYVREQAGAFSGK